MKHISFPLAPAGPHLIKCGADLYLWFLPLAENGIASHGISR